MGLSLSKKELEHYREGIEKEFAVLMGHRRFSGRRNARQWQFFRHCFHVLMDNRKGDFDCTDKEAVNYKFEVNSKLRRHYLSFGEPIEFVFSLVSERKDGRSDSADEDYPSSNGYYLRVFFNKDRPDKIQLRKLLIEKTVGWAIDAEFRAYEKLPDLLTEELEQVFETSCSAYKRILNLLRSHQKRGWSLSNTDNPSTKRLIDIKIRQMTDNFAEVDTTEYWLLMWWSAEKQKYAHTYNETNRQKYFLTRKKKKWLVGDNPYEKPKTSTPRRNIRHFQTDRS